jgi:hypothetical protein
MLEKLRALMVRAEATRFGRALRTGLLVLALLAGCLLLAHGVDQHYPLRKWLIWRYAGYWAGALLLALTCLCAGLPIVDRLGRDFRFAERLLLAHAVGVVVFFQGMFVLGILGLYHWLVFFAWPAALLAFGARRLWRLGQRVWGLRGTLARAAAPGLLPWRTLATLFGIVALVILYSQIIHPLQVSYDARWYHLSLAEQYAAEGAIRRFPDGSYVNAYPQLTSLLYTWAFLLPTATLFDKVGLCTHVIFVMFACILLGVGLLTRRLLRRPAPGAWCAVFLFPGLFLYDSGLHLGADHVAAFFAVPFALTAFVTFQRWQTGSWLLLALMVAGATLAKYSVAALFVLPGLALVLRGLWCAVRGGRQQAWGWLRPPLLALAAVLLLTSPHWLKNWLFYGNPFYPYAASLFEHAPWADYNRRLFETWSSTHEWSPRGTLAHRLGETARALPTFAFVPHDWPAFHGNVPVFGFLFTLSGLALPFVRGRTGRIWFALLATYVGIFLWYWGMHQDRYLQVLLPWMAAITAAILILAWRSSPWAKLPLAALLALQVAWGSDVPFIPGHAMLGKAPTVAAIELAQTGLQGRTANRLHVFEPYESMGKALTPKRSRLMLHEHHLSLGLGVMVLQDWAHTQGLVDYGSKPSLRAVYDMLEGMGVTHIAWVPRQSMGWSGYAGDLIFFDFLRTHTEPPRSFGGFSLAKLKKGVDVDLRSAKVFFAACGNGYAKGLYGLSALNFPDIVVTDPNAFPKPDHVLSSPVEIPALIAASRYIVYDPGCGTSLARNDLRRFSQLATRSTVQLWARAEP